ncbi:INCREASED PETAL GROWTH ANISOTROPY 1-like protein 1 isoform X1 [Daucus carota subsp. sativus]|nr:PREDICTED: protein CHUP1, chloroplastic isoform X1 [Daucus carota subsp. sativus]XP_017218332.1 PREDICTED: protein CHUP1, chloroplastic isoform X1 [Daucus carota subsp. sativus]XP_017218334.1 PREDICTED: protein CHUP1, chloroplastic isoform X1 [Daucus carota subsp. sativus]
MMKHNSAMKNEEETLSVSISTPPPRFRVSGSSKSKNLQKTEVLNGGVSVSCSPQSRRANSVPPRDAVQNGSSSQKMIRRSILNNRPKSGEGCVSGSQGGREFEEIKVVHRSVSRGVVESYARPNKNTKKRSDIDMVDVKKVLEEKLDQKEILIRELQSEVLELKAELGRSQSLNAELQSRNKKLSDDLALAEAKNTDLTTTKEKDLVAEIPSSKFKDIQKLIANKLESSMAKKDSVIETSTKIAPTAATRSPGAGIANVQPKFYDCPSNLPPPPPPPLPPRRAAKAASPRKASPVVEMFQALTTKKGKNPSVGGNYSKQIASSAHNSIVGEIQNRSAHLLAIKSDIETRGEFIESLIQKVLAAAYQDIEDVLQFVDWLDNELSSLADERAVLRHFQWPEKKADAMREAAIEYRSLKLLETEVYSYKDDTTVPCGTALKKMAGLLDKSERSIQRLIKLRNSVMATYKNHKIPTDWMLDSGTVAKIKQASRMLAKMYMKRVILELESFRYSERESTQEAFLLQGVHFAYRAHQFSGGLDSETLCAFEEIRQRVPGHLQSSREIFSAIPLS